MNFFFFCKIKSDHAGSVFLSADSLAVLDLSKGGATKPGKVVGAVRYGSRTTAATEETQEQRKLIRDPAVPIQYASSSCSYPRRNPTCKSERADEEALEGPTAMQPKPQYIAPKVVAANGETACHW